MRDPDPAIRKHAIAKMEDYILRPERATLEKLAKDENEQVRQQLAYMLSYSIEDRALGGLLPQIACDNAANPYILAAALSSVDKNNWKNFLAEVMKRESIPAPMLSPLVRMAKAFGEPLDSAQLFVRQIGTQDKKPNMKQLGQVADMLESLRANGMSVREMVKSIKAKEVVTSVERLSEIHEFAVDIINNPKEATRDRAAAVRVLDRGLANDRNDQKLLIALLTPRTPDELQAAAILQLSQTDDPRVVGMLLTPWKSYTPALRNQVLDAVMGRVIWTRLTIEAIKAKQVPVQEIDAIRRQRLLQHKDAEIRAAAAKLFASASNSDRGKVVDLYWLQMPAKADAMRGAKLFTKSCATCHKLGDVGQNVGPDLLSVGDKSPQGLLTAILDPNRAVESRHTSTTWRPP